MTDAPTRPLLPRRRAAWSIQSLLLVMLLLVSVTSNVVIGFIGYTGGTDSLRDAVTERVVEARDSRARALTELFATIENSMLVNARGASVIGAMGDFTRAFGELDDSALEPEQSAALDAYYRDGFGPALAAALDEPVDVSAFLPEGTAERYLQYWYTASADDFAEAIAVDDAGDGSTWSAVNAEYHAYFQRMTQLLDYQDTLLIDLDGDVVYSAYKGVDLGTNLLDGPYRLTNLADAYRQAISGRLLDSVVFTDFETYRPSLDTPAAWGVALISDGGEVIGALAVEMPIQRIADVMTSGGAWAESGLGETGEAYLVGGDGLMRSPSRVLMEDPAGFAERAAAVGVDPATVEREVSSGATLLLQPVTTLAAERALRGETGSVVAPGYLGEETIAAYAPLGVEDLGWAVVAEVASQEAFAPVTDFTTRLIISSAILVLIISVLSLVIAQVLVRPLKRLRTAAERIAAGETDVEVDVGTTDELSSLAAAFNDMSRSLRIKADLLEQQEKENERLLLSLMPEAVAKRYREGDRTIAQDHQEAAVLFADIVGFEDFGATMDSEHALEVLNEIVKNFDEAAERFGIERVRTTRQGYLASCGMSVPRIDATRRVVEFAQAIDAILHRFNGQHGSELRLRAGIDLGQVTSGLVGLSHVTYDLWGDAVNLAFRVQSAGSEPGIYITERVMTRVGDAFAAEPAGEVTTRTGVQRVWRVESDHARV
ncbi:MAG: HAMP domain-containing protein [Actinomycetales bacterium]|nr:HAMP domain-containing protein [Actinomycetales bacterium]